MYISVCTGVVNECNLPVLSCKIILELIWISNVICCFTTELRNLNSSLIGFPAKEMLLIIFLSYLLLYLHLNQKNPFINFTLTKYCSSYWLAWLKWTKWKILPWKYTQREFLTAKLVYKFAECSEFLKTNAFGFLAQKECFFQSHNIRCFTVFLSLSTLSSVEWFWFELLSSNS